MLKEDIGEGKVQILFSLARVCEAISDKRALEYWDKIIDNYLLQVLLGKAMFYQKSNDISKMIFNSQAKGKMLFPEDSLCGKAQRIIEKKDVCSAAAFELWCERNSNVRTQDQAKKLLQENNIHVVENPLVSFEHDEIDNDCKEWDTFGKYRFLEKVTFIPFFKPIN